MEDRTFSRRDVIRLAAGAVIWPQAATRTSLIATPVRFGVIADVHHGLGTRTEERLADFLEKASRRPLDFIVQMGDFNHPEPEAVGFLKLWQSHKGPRYGVIGNHDMDKGSKPQAVENWRIPGRHYSFDSGFLHFVVLDANFMKLDGKLVPYEKGNWYRSGITSSWIDPEQLDWLRADLSQAKKPTLIFVHQGIDETQGGGAVPNRAEVRKILEDSGKIVACLMGHHHVDTDETRNGIYYWRVNSASYAWVGENYGRMAPYDRSLHAFVTIWADGRMEVEGRRSIFEGDSPFARGVPNPDLFSSSIISRAEHLMISRVSG